MATFSALYMILRVLYANCSLQVLVKLICLLFQAFREEIVPINLKVKAINDLSSQLSPVDLHPSLKMTRQLDDLNMRWKLLQVSRFGRAFLYDSLLFL